MKQKHKVGRDFHKVLLGETEGDRQEEQVPQPGEAEGDREVQVPQQGEAEGDREEEQVPQQGEAEGDR